MIAKILSKVAQSLSAWRLAALLSCDRSRREHDSSTRAMTDTLGEMLKDARARTGLSLRKVEAQTGIRNAHLSQIENGVITKPEMAMLWELAALYELDYSELLRLAGYGAAEPSKRASQRMTVALRAMGSMPPSDQEAVLQFMAELKGKRGDDEPPAS